MAGAISETLAADADAESEGELLNEPSKGAREREHKTRWKKKKMLKRMSKVLLLGYEPFDRFSCAVQVTVELK